MDSTRRWIQFPDASLEVRGLAWFAECAPDLWRLPGWSMDRVPEAVGTRARFPGGGRIRFRTGTSQLCIRLWASDIQGVVSTSAYGSRGLDLYVDRVYWNSVLVDEVGETERMFFCGANRCEKDITIYLPLFQEMRILAIGVDHDADVHLPAPFSKDAPLVVYGSSVAQGAGACRPGMSYAAILARHLNIDFVNLGFGGAGRAETDVVTLVAGIEACCFLLDLGKSFGIQPIDVYTAMLATIRSFHPDVPLVCITPIFSTREYYDAEFIELSRHTRHVVRAAVADRKQAGDDAVYLIEGSDLLGPGEADAFHEGVHPTDLGYMRIAERLRPILQTILGLSPDK